MTTGKTIALTRRTFVGKVISLLLNMLSTSQPRGSAEPQVTAGPRKADTCLQNKQQEEDAQSAETPRGCDRLGRGDGSQGCEADLPGKSLVPLAHRMGC